ncbi:three-Cys-motif partner protein TcmP [Priestia megaterium]|uniref:three-Cys-motif partner protein TcmP n=1 Tax=Priestia megaterium TaxID=1404 RepID=UPI0025A42868|nr:three-Cys-motif partner protein TcmP [Priestia megaterium]MDM8151048.1 three-Cys-motif partner protein TcmP [Priestia megaterium]
MNFFAELQDHSEVKLSILENYTIPWMRKIILNPFNKSKRCLLIDGFAGTGIYDDNRKGSSMIMVEAAMDFYSQAVKNGWDEPDILIYLNELNTDNHKSLISNIESLGFESMDDKWFSSNDFESITIMIENKAFEEFFDEILNIGEGKTLIPSFCFVDPFGFSQTPFRLFEKYLKNENSELLINFIYEHTNRFITHPNEKVRARISTHMGLVGLNDLSDKVSGLDPLERKKVIIETYTNNILNETDAVHVKHFDIKKNRRTKMILFYATKNINGLKLMKETMWKHDETGLFTYDDKQQMVQLDFETILSTDKQMHINLLSEAIYNNFSKRKNISCEHIEVFTIIETIYPLTNFVKPALKILEEQGKITNFKGRKKIKTYPAKTRMDFN